MNSTQTPSFELAGAAGEPTLLVRHEAGPGPSVLYVHGATFPCALSLAYRFDGRSWLDDLRSRGFDVWGFDFAGYGGSQRPAAFAAEAALHAPLGRVDEAMGQLARVVAHVRRTMHRERVSLIAHSWGSLVAGRFATRCPEQVERLVLFGPIARREQPAPPAPTGAWRLMTIEQQLARFIEDDPTGAPSVLLEPALQAWGPAYLASDAGAAQRGAVKIPNGPQADIAAAWSGSFPYDPAQVHAPTLIVRGEWDSLCDDDDARWLLDHLGCRDKRDVRLPRGTHLMHLEQGRGLLYDATAQWLQAPATLADAPSSSDPQALYAALRDKDDGFSYDASLKCWVASSRQAVEAALAHPGLRVRPPAEPVPAPLLGTPAGEVFGGLMRQNDGPRHDDAKPPVAHRLAALQPARVREAASRVATQRLVDVQSLNEAMFDAPLLVLAEVLELRPGQREALTSRVRALVAGWSPRADATQREAAQAPAQALLDRFDGDANRIGLFTQTCEATAGLVGQTLVALQRQPALWSTLLQGDDDSCDALLTEIARSDAPVQNTRRFAAETLTLCGRTLHSGDAVLVLLAGANHDPSNATGEVYTWGAGVHACPGAKLSRSLASGVIRAWHAAGSDLAALSAHWTYLPSANARLPRFVA